MSIASKSELKEQEMIEGKASASAGNASPQPLPSQLIQSKLDEREEEAGEEKLTTPQVLPIKTIGRGCLALTGGKFATLLKLEGLDMKLMSQPEKNGLVRRMSNLFNNLNGPVAFYCTIRPRNMQSYLQNLDRKRAAELNSSLRQQYWIEQDFVSRLDEENSLTERNYYVALQATPADLISSRIAGGDSDNEGEEDEEEAARNFWQVLQDRFKVAVLGQDPTNVGSNPKTKAGSDPDTFSSSTQREKDTNRHIPPTLAEALRFRGQSLADQLSANRMPARLLNSEEIVTTLGEMLASPFTGSNNNNSTNANNSTSLTNTSTNTSTRSGKGKEINPLYRIGGAALEEHARYLKLGSNTFVSCLYVTDFPKSMKLGALFEIIRFKDIQMQVALQVTPISNQRAESRLKNRQQILFAVAANDQSSAGDLQRSYKIESIRTLRDVLARGDARLFTVGIRIAIRASSRSRMQADVRRVSQRLTEMGYPVATADRNQRRAFFSTLPLGHDWLATEKFISDRTVHSNMTGENIACLLPNCIVDFTQKGGIILGISKSDGSLITFNRWKLISPHTVICASTGSGKTVSMEAEIMREMMNNPELGGYYIDPQGALGNFAALVGGTTIDLGTKGNAVINPMDRYVLNGQAETIGERLTFLYPLLELMTRAELSASERSAVSRAVKRLYRHFEEGEDMRGTLELNYANHPLYVPLRPYLRDYQNQQGEWQPGIMTRLTRIYEHLKAKYNIPHSGLVRGLKEAAYPQRPVCHLAAGRWIYRGEGEINEPLVEANGKESGNSSELKPAQVWHPDPTWLKSLADDFSQLVQDEGIFDSLDLTARGPAIRDAFVALKLGMPILSDLFPFLAAEGAIGLVSNLDQYIDPEIFGKLFNGFTNVALDRRFISFNVKDLGEELLRPIRIFQTINYTWGMVRAIKKPRIFVVDEFGLLVQNFQDVGNYVRDLFMRGRFFYLSMVAIVQNITSLLDYQAALQCVENAERVILMRQQATAVHRLKAHFELTDGQLYVLLGAEPGEALERVAGRWVHVSYSIPPEHLAQYDTRPVNEATHAPGNTGDFEEVVV